MSLHVEKTTNTPRTYLFHEINNKIMLQIIKLSEKEPEAVFTFDDGLYSNYKYFDVLKTLPNKKIFFISLGIIRSLANEPNDSFIKCADAHNQKDNSYYMDLFELGAIVKDKNSFLGVHGYYHSHLDLTHDGLISRITFPEANTNILLPETLENYKQISQNDSSKESNIIIKGISDCLTFFRFEHSRLFELSTIFEMGDTIYYAFPYNIESKFIKNEIKKIAKGFEKEVQFFGKERIEL